MILSGSEMIILIVKNETTKQRLNYAYRARLTVKNTVDKP